MNLKHDIGAILRTFAGGGGNLTAGGGGDNTEIDGSWLSRAGYHSAKLIIHYRATLAQAATLSIAANIQDATSNAGAGAADYGTARANAVVATGPTGGGTVRGTVEMDFTLDKAREFVRGQATPDLSAANTDTATLEMIWVFSGADRNPITLRSNA